MARVDLCNIHISDVERPDDQVRLKFVRSWDKHPSVAGEVRHGAAGRVRLVRFEDGGGMESWPMTFGSVTQEQRAWLVAHMGRMVCVRDDRGGKIFGSYLEAPSTERVGWSKDADNMRVTFQQLTFTEEV